MKWNKIKNEKKCTMCGEVKPLTHYYKDKRSKDDCRSECKVCSDIRVNKYNQTEIGYLNKKYRNMVRKGSENRRSNKRLLTFDELLAAFEKHKSIHGMKSAWGPGPDHLEQHLPITVILNNRGKKAKRINSNLSVDRLDNSRDYTVQNIIFIRSDENSRKRDTTYNDCLTHVRLHEERFKNEI